MKYCCSTTNLFTRSSYCLAN